MRKSTIFMMFLSLALALTLSGCLHIVSRTSSPQSEASVVITSPSGLPNDVNVFEYIREQGKLDISTTASTDPNLKLLAASLTNLCSGTFYRDEFISSIENNEIFYIDYLNLYYTVNEYYEGQTNNSDDYFAIIEVDEWSFSEAAGWITFDTILASDDPQGFNTYMSTDLPAGTAKLIVDDNDRLMRVETPIGNYSKMADEIDDFINEKTLEGTYQDSEGNTYQFTSDRQAIWPGRTFDYTIFGEKYVICTDSAMECNTFFVVDKLKQIKTGENFGYIFVEDSLYIYNVIAGQPFGYYSEGDPILILHRVD